jgi:hypothetical protein
MFADARRGLEMRQQRPGPTDTRLPLPAPIALEMLHAADRLRDTLTWTPAYLPCIELFRAFLAVCVNYTFFSRAETRTCCLTYDMTIDRPS